ncbi:MAG: hypothetical protein ABSG93_15085 [Solirubrobacteraceae bacterium]
MPGRPRAALGLAAGLATLLLAGCGSSGTRTVTVQATAPSSTPGVSATKAQFVAQAEAICRKLNAQEQPLKARQETLKGLPNSTAEKIFVSVARQVVTVSRAADGKLRALPRPAGDAHAIEQLLTGFSEEVADASEIADAAVSQENNLAEGAEQGLKRSVAENSAAAAEYGMKDCIGSE